MEVKEDLQTFFCLKIKSFPDLSFNSYISIMPSSGTTNREERMRRLLRNRRARRHSFFLSEFPAFGLFLIISFGGIVWVAISILTANVDIENPSSLENSFVISRFWFQRFVGIANLSAFISFWVQAHGLVGTNGILPVHKQLNLTQAKVDTGMLLLGRFEYFPTLLWCCFKKKFMKKNTKKKRKNRESSDNTSRFDMLYIVCVFKLLN